MTPLSVIFFYFRKDKVMRKIKKNTIYRHFKGNNYLVLDIVYNTDTDEEMVLYKSLYEDCKSYVRPLSIFASEVDHEKYPNIKQKYKYVEIKVGSNVK